MLDDETVRTIRELNKQDVDLYEFARKVFMQRLALFEAGLEYVHGRVSGLENGKLSGWAVYPPSIEPVLIDVLVNDVQVAAKNNRPTMRE